MFKGLISTAHAMWSYQQGEGRRDIDECFALGYTFELFLVLSNGSYVFKKFFHDCNNWCFSPFALSGECS